MEIIPFEELDVTTSTYIIYFNGIVDYKLLWHLLPITKVEVQQTRKTSRCKLPHCPIPGAMLSISSPLGVRGIIRSKRKVFRNSTSIDMSVTSKNVNIKLSSCSIHITGARSSVDSEEATEHLIKHIIKIQSILNFIQKNPEMTNECLTWVKTITKGPETESYIKTCEKQFGNRILNIHRKVKYNTIIEPNEKIPHYLDEELTKFLLSFGIDFMSHADMCKKLDMIPNIKSVYQCEESTIEPDANAPSMVNYNFKLGFGVRRDKLKQLINQRCGFVALFDKALGSYVKIELPYAPNESIKFKRKKNVIPHITFIVYKSGAVTFSGPGGNVMRDAYYLLMKIIMQIREEIEWTESHSEDSEWVHDSDES